MDYRDCVREPPLNTTETLLLVLLLVNYLVANADKFHFLTRSKPPVNAEICCTEISN